MKRNLLAVCLVVVATTGCEKIQEKIAKKAAEKAIEGAAGGDVKVDTSSGGVTISDRKTGTVVNGGAAVKLPDGWPSSVPIYPGAAVRNAMTSSGGMSVTLATKDPAAAVGAFYKSKAPALKLETDMDLGQQRIMAFKEGKRTVSISVGAAGAETMVTIAVVE